MFNWLDFNPSENGEVHVPSLATCRLADEIAHKYVIEAGKYQNSSAAVKQKHAKYFYKAAELCLEQSISAEMFVRQQVAAMAATGKIWPNAIATKSLTGLVADSNKLTHLDISKYKAMLATYELAASIHSPQAVLTSSQFLLSPLFRTMCAHQLGLTNVVNTYLEEAKAEFAQSEVAQTIFPEFKALCLY